MTGLAAPSLKLTVLRPDEMRAAARACERYANRDRSGAGREESLPAALQLALGVVTDPGEKGEALPVTAVEASGWVSGVLARLRGTAEMEPVPLPRGFVGRLRPYQERGLTWLAFLARWGLGACLADDMGLGKTVQTIALLLHEKELAESGGHAEHGGHAEGGGYAENGGYAVGGESAFLNPGLLGSAARFRQRFTVPIQVNGDASAVERLRSLVGPFLLRRVKTDRAIIDDLPEKVEMKVFCSLTREQATLYEAVARDMMLRIEEARDPMQRRGLVVATLTRLKQVCNHPAQFLGDGSALGGRSGKLDRLVEMLEEALAEGDGSLVFTQFAEMGELLSRHLEVRLGFAVPFLQGKTPRAVREEMVAQFRRPDGPPIFILSLKAGGTGLNLTRATRVFHFDRWWNPAVEDQATDRAYRIGQSRAVHVHKLVTAGTVEERIDDIVEAKRGLADSLVGSGEGWLAELSTEELRRLITLGEEAQE